MSKPFVLLELPGRPREARPGGVATEQDATADAAASSPGLAAARNPFLPSQEPSLWSALAIAITALGAGTLVAVALAAFIHN